MSTVYLTRQFDRIDRICFETYGTTATRQVETVLDQNPGLEKYGILLPAGIRITLPDVDTADTTPIAKKIKLWE